jgi:hypothetical protein
LEGLLPEAAMSSLSIVALDGVPTFISSFCVSYSTSTAKDSLEVFTNCPIATLSPKIVATLP